ncbi:trehalose synthase-fused probable maltokinase [mine drainage metagenome]|uniref:Trehalose synthase-fused probable maltokinase n=1 Tax=mine drainage metagenome TaxID=410659 RepID=T1D4A4_9ZZZZ
MLFEKSKNKGDYEKKIISEMKTATSEIARITAEMHEGLSSLKGKEFEPIFIGKEYTHKIRSDALDMVKAISDYNIDLKVGIEIKSSNELCKSLENLLEKIDINKIEGSMAIRVHGDFHLGQILKTVRGPMIIDFEGEPLRTDRERSSKQSPMKDVAGMIRSIDYVLNFSVQNMGGNSELARKESNILRNIFLEEYWNSAAGLNLIPSSFVKFEKSSEYFELEKAIYELNYELKNRLEWVGIPGNAIVKIIQMMR